MKNSVNDRSEIKDFLSRYGFFIISLGYLLIAFALLPDYGLGFDSPKNFREGWINLNYLLTGRAALNDQLSLAFQIHGAFFFMIADIFKRILSDGLGWLDPISAQHAFLPVLVFFFINLYYAFLQKKTEPQVAFLTCALLLTIPSFFGHTFNNIKDIPLLVFFSLSILCFYEWHNSGFQRSRYLYGAFFGLGLTLLSKLYAILIPVIWVLWLTVLKLRSYHKKDMTEAELLPSKRLLRRENILRGLIGFALVLALAALFFMPAFYSIEEKMIFLKIKSRVAKKLMTHGNQGWSFYPWIQVFYIMPILTLATAVLGVIKTLLQKSLNTLSALMLTWFFTVMFAACTPFFPVYHGIRLFMVFLVPFSFFSATGVTFTVEFLGKTSPIKKTWGTWLLGILLVAFQIAGITQTHPYETTFFNCLAGGLKGAQEKNVPDAADYWLISYREAVRWINEKAPQNANLLVPGSDSFLLLEYYPLRKDVRFDLVRAATLPKNSFLMIASGEGPWVNVTPVMKACIQKEMSRMMKVHEIQRQGGNILTIYYKP